MKTILAREPIPENADRSLFLAGPSPRSKKTPSWRPDALAMLDNFDGMVFVPEPRGGSWEGDYYYEDQIEWEEKTLNASSVILFWVPRSPDMLALTTNDEWGTWKTKCPSKLVFGSPPDAFSVNPAILC